MNDFIIYSAENIALLLIGMQIQINELPLMKARYNYDIGAAQWVTYFSLSLATGITVSHFVIAKVMPEIVSTLTIVPLFVLSEYLLALLSPSRAAASWLWRIAVTVISTWLAGQIGASMGTQIQPVIPFIAAGLYLRNSPFGITHGKDMWIANCLKRKPEIKFDDCYCYDDRTPDCSFAGIQHTSKQSEIFDVTDYGVVANSRADQTDKIQHVIDTAGKAGGGTVYFPKGRYIINRKGDTFLKINYSDITLRGATDSKGNPVAELVNCGKTSRGHKNPWLSPFMITTAEHIQPSNEFWGLQFRNKRNAFSRSNSLSDPGSDGEILSPTFATKITVDAFEGETILHVEDSAKVGKYILIGLYNTTDDGNLIRDILGMNLRTEWTMANRAGAEQAPSYQWLTEVKRIVDSRTIELARPLLRHCQKAFTPEVYNVDMLEHITVRDLLISSRWNGLFRHHGFPLYYSIRKTQEMDYGWNAINMKRVAHGEISNVIIKNFTNPLYVTDSRNVTVSNIRIKGYDGHQGLKIYSHACDNLFENITFYNHFADMMGGEGNAYGNVFKDIYYFNPVFKPVDYDFHGFVEAPMSPPSDNIFIHIFGFRYIKAAGPISHQPSCAQNNIWWDTITEGEKEDDYIFYAMSYRQKTGLIRLITAIGYAVAIVQKTHRLSPRAFMTNVREKLRSIDNTGSPRSQHYSLYFPKSIIKYINTSCKLPDGM